MKVTYTDKSEALNPKQRAKFDQKLQKFSKLLERKGEKEAHVIVTSQRYLHKVEITLNAMEHSMVGAASDADAMKGGLAALDRLEKQVLKQANKWRDKRYKGKATQMAAEPAAKPEKPVKANSAPVVSATNGSGRPRKKVFRVNPSDGNKPMTLEEAMIEMEASQDYMVYRDAQTDKVSVLMRRTDGHFDLIES